MQETSDIVGEKDPDGDGDLGEEELDADSTPTAYTQTG